MPSDTSRCLSITFNPQYQVDGLPYQLDGQQYHIDDPQYQVDGLKANPFSNSFLAQRPKRRPRIRSKKNN